jgi:hypothetical protein
MECCLFFIIKQQWELAAAKAVPNGQLVRDSRARGTICREELSAHHMGKSCYRYPAIGVL